MTCRIPERGSGILVKFFNLVGSMPKIASQLRGFFRQLSERKRLLSACNF